MFYRDPTSSTGWSDAFSPHFIERMTKVCKALNITDYEITTRVECYGDNPVSAVFVVRIGEVASRVSLTADFWQSLCRLGGVGAGTEEVVRQTLRELTNCALNGNGHYLSGV